MKTADKLPMQAPSQSRPDLFVQKLTATPPTANPSGLRQLCSKLCTDVKTLPNKVGQLLLFHVLNVLVMIVAAIFAVLMLINTALAPCWFATWVVVVVVVMVVRLLALVERKVLMYLGFVVLFVLFLAFMYFCVYEAAILSCIYCATCVGYVVFALCGCAVRGLVKKDVRLASFAEAAVSLTTEEPTTPDPDACAKRFTFPNCNELEFVSPHITLTRRVWSLVFYYAVPKVMVGSASALVVVVVAIEPIIAICTLGNDPFVGSWVDVHNRPWVYIVVLLLLWMVGVFGLFVVAKVSNKLTFFVCGEWRCEQTATDRQDEDDIEATTPSTPTQEPTATNYSQV